MNRLHLETYRLRNSRTQLAIERGIAVTACGGQLWLDPQRLAPNTVGDPGPARRSRLKLALSQQNPPHINERGMVEQLSIDQNLRQKVLGGLALRHFRAFRPTRHSQPAAALIAVQDDIDPFGQRLEREDRGDTFHLGPDYEIAHRRSGLILLRPGEAVTINRTYGRSSPVTFDLAVVYDPATSYHIRVDSALVPVERPGPELIEPVDSTPSADLLPV